MHVFLASLVFLATINDEKNQNMAHGSSDIINNPHYSSPLHHYQMIQQILIVSLLIATAMETPNTITMGETTIETLPVELILNILSRLPIDSLIQSRSVCKPWGSLLPIKKTLKKVVENLTVSPEFLSEVASRLALDSMIWAKYQCSFWQNSLTDRRLAMDHYENQLKSSTDGTSLVIFSMCKPSFEVYAVPDIDACNRVIKLGYFPFHFTSISTFSVVGSSNGFMCMRNEDCNEFFICNPVIGDLFILPDPPAGGAGTFVGFGYNRNSKEYKVTRARRSGTKGTITIDVLTVGHSSWRSNIATIRLGFFTERMEGVFLNGYLFWVVFDLNKMFTSIWSFDLNEEKSSVFSIPNFMKQYRDYQVDWRVLAGRLALIFYRDGEIQIWGTKIDGGVESWSSLDPFTIPFPTQNGRAFRPRVLGRHRKGKVLVQGDSTALYSYDPEDRVHQKITVHGLPRRYKVVTLVGTLVTIKDVIGL